MMRGLAIKIAVCIIAFWGIIVGMQNNLYADDRCKLTNSRTSTYESKCPVGTFCDVYLNESGYGHVTTCADCGKLQYIYGYGLFISEYGDICENYELAATGSVDEIKKVHTPQIYACEDDEDKLSINMPDDQFCYLTEASCLAHQLTRCDIIVPTKRTDKYLSSHFMLCGHCSDMYDTCGGYTHPTYGAFDDVCGCTPKTCSDYYPSCGTLDTGCGVTIDCSCPEADEICDRGLCKRIEIVDVDLWEAYNKGPAFFIAQCEKEKPTCSANDCGIIYSCGLTTVDCGTSQCASPKTCGGGTGADGKRIPNQCGCTPKTCEDKGANCDSIDDGCGATINCGTCPDGQKCINRGCCKPLTCEQIAAECGEISDGCNGKLNCGACDAGLTCASNKCISTQHLGNQAGTTGGADGGGTGGGAAASKSSGGCSLIY